MFLPCHKCGGASHPALAHLTGLTQPYCKDCARDAFVKRIEGELERRRLSEHLTAASWRLACEYIKEQCDAPTLRFPLKEHTPRSHL